MRTACLWMESEKIKGAETASLANDEKKVG